MFSTGFNCSKNVELLVPEQQVLPEDIFSGKKKRVRASKKKTASEWIWGDEEWYVWTESLELSVFLPKNLKEIYKKVLDMKSFVFLRFF